MDNPNICNTVGFSACTWRDYLRSVGLCVLCVVYMQKKHEAVGDQFILQCIYE